MGNRNARRAQPGLAGYGPGPDPNYGMDYYGGAYEPSGLTCKYSVVIFRSLYVIILKHEIIL